MIIRRERSKWLPCDLSLGTLRTAAIRKAFMGHGELWPWSSLSCYHSSWCHCHCNPLLIVWAGDHTQAFFSFIKHHDPSQSRRQTQKEWDAAIMDFIDRRWSPAKHDKTFWQDKPRSKIIFIVTYNMSFLKRTMQLRGSNKEYPKESLLCNKKDEFTLD